MFLRKLVQHPGMGARPPRRLEVATLAGRAGGRVLSAAPTKTWHTLVATLRGKKLTVEIDGKRTFEKTVDAAPSGRVGPWSKADSQVLFDEFRVERL